MASILDTIAAATRDRIEKQKLLTPLAELKELCVCLPSAEGAAFKEALAKPGLSIIAEVKKASPSKGVIAEDFPYLEIARSYQDGGADAISCLTEPQWFMGSDAIFQEIAGQVGIPMLRKDFTVGEYQIYQARLMGASAVLLICAILSDEQLAAYLELAHSLGLEALVEAHDAGEIARAVNAGATVIGVNNRNLKDFSVDIGNAERLRDAVPASCVYVAESGVGCAEDIARVAALGADAALVGEALMRSAEKAATITSFKAAAAEAVTGQKAARYE